MLNARSGALSGWLEVKVIGAAYRENCAWGLNHLQVVPIAQEAGNDGNNQEPS